MATTSIPIADIAPVKAVRTPMRRDEVRTAVLFLLPSLLGFVVFMLFPLVASFLLSFTNWQLIVAPKFVGVDNFVRLFTRDPTFYRVLGNTLFYTFEYLVLNVVISLGLAVWISSMKRAQRWYRLIFFLPTFTPMIAVSVVWAAPWLVSLMPCFPQGWPAGWHASPGGSHRARCAHGSHRVSWKAR